MDDTTLRFSLLEMNDIPTQPYPTLQPDDSIPAIEWDDVPATVPNGTIVVPATTRIESVEHLYKGHFHGHPSIEAAKEAIPELCGTVSKESLFLASGLSMPGSYGTIRTCPDGTKQALGIVGERYEVIQDAEAFRIMETLAKHCRFRTYTAGVYRAKSWLYGEAGTFHADILPGDTIEARCLVGNSHDGSIPWSFGFPGNRVVCQNTFHMALSSKLSRLLKVRHTAGADAIVKQVQAAVEAFGMEFVTAVDKFKYLAATKATEDTVKELYTYVFKPSKWADTEEEDTEQRNSKVYAKMVENYESGAGATPGTVWGAYNAVTEYLTHQRSREGTAQEASFADLQWGNGANLARRALEGALSIATAA